MSARSFPAVVTPDAVPSTIDEMFRGMNLSKQNQLHGELKSIKQFAEVFSRRENKEAVFEAISRGLKGRGDLLSGNLACATKGAFVEVAVTMARNGYHGRVLEEIAEVCLEELLCPRRILVGFRLFAEPAVSLILCVLEKSPTEVVEETVLLLLKVRNQDVLVRTLQWIIGGERKVTSVSVYEQVLLHTNPWTTDKRVAAGAIAVLCEIAPVVGSTISLETCQRYSQTKQDKWIAVSGCAITQVR
jgi:hypothetical protein